MGNQSIGFLFFFTFKQIKRKIHWNSQTRTQKRHQMKMLLVEKFYKAEGPIGKISRPRGFRQNFDVCRVFTLGFGAKKKFLFLIIHSVCVCDECDGVQPNIFYERKKKMNIIFSRQTSTEKQKCRVFFLGDSEFLTQTHTHTSKH